MMSFLARDSIYA